MVRPWTADEHVAVSYEDHDERVALLKINLTDALERGEKFVYLAESSSVEDITVWLRGERLAPMITRGQFVIHPADALVATNGTFDSDQVINLVTRECHEATRAGYTGTRVCGEMTWALREPIGPDRVLGYERRLGEVLADGGLPGLRLVCNYALNRMPNGYAAPVWHAHPCALTAEQARHLPPLLRVDRLEGSGGLRLSGEVDRSNIAELSIALESTFRKDRDFHVCLADVHYVDVAAVRLLVQTAAKLADGYRFILRSPGPLIRAILRIYGWDQLPSLLMLEGACMSPGQKPTPGTTGAVTGDRSRS